MFICFNCSIGILFYFRGDGFESFSSPIREILCVCTSHVLPNNRVSSGLVTIHIKRSVTVLYCNS